MVRKGALIVPVATAFTIWNWAKDLCTSCFAIVWKEALWKALAIYRFKTIRITNITLVTWIDFVTRPAWPKSCTNAFSIKARILESCLRTLSPSLADEPNWISLILRAVHSSDSGISLRPSILSRTPLSGSEWPLTLTQRAAIRTQLTDCQYFLQHWMRRQFVRPPAVYVPSF